MDPWKKKLKFWKLYFLRIIPYLILAFLLFCALSTIRDASFSTEPGLSLSSNCADLAPGEIVPCMNNHQETNPHDSSYYNTVFKRFFDEGYISQTSKVLTVDNINGHDVLAVKKLGVPDVTGITDMPSALFIVSGQSNISHPFGNNTFDFEFFGCNTRFKYWTARPAHTASEIGRTLKAGGYVAVHLVINDEYSYNSFINLFTCCVLVSSRVVRGLEHTVPFMHELVFMKETYPKSRECTISEVRRKIVDNLEPLVTFEHPYAWEGPWGYEEGALKYLSSMVDLSFKERYVFIDVGANTYASSIGTWFKKEYPKQNKPFEIFAIEADKAYYEEYKGKAGVTLLPYAAWVRNETLRFEVYKLPPNDGQIWKEMGYIPEKKGINEHDILSVLTVEAFDLAEWILRTVTQKDYVVMKMDAEGAEVKLVKTLSESGALCLIDEFFLECHYDRAGDNGARYKTKLSGCLEIYRKLRKEGCIVHQWF